MVPTLNFMWAQSRGNSLFPHYYDYAKGHQSGKFLTIEEFIKSDENIHRCLKCFERMITDKKFPV